MVDNDDRKRAILAIVLEILKRDGAAGLSTAALAAEARCSKSTLYTLFGSRDGILRALIAEQSLSVNRMLEQELAEGRDAEETLARAGAALLDLLTGEASLAINKAAMTDASGELGRLLLEQGRGGTAPLFLRLIERLQAASVLGVGEPQVIFFTYYGLLMGDRQIRLLLGDRSARPTGKTFRATAEEAAARLKMVYTPDD